MIDSNVPMNYLSAGLSALPADRTKKCPLGKWKEWQTRMPTQDEERAWFANKPDAICIVCGKVSGNLEVLDFDNHGELFPKWKESIPADLLAKLVIEQTPSGGYHVAYRCSDEVCGNIKLAQGVRNDKTVTLIETRGEGGLVLCAPTEGYTIQSGDYVNLPRLTTDERVTLLNTAWHMNEAKRGSQPTLNDMPNGFTMMEPNPSSFEQRPGDDFNMRGDVRGLLEHHGWQSLGIQPDGNEYWRRPGKETDGNSATLKDGVFYVFSSNAAPLEGNHGYVPFTVYALLEHGGDFGKAAGCLLENGYGKAMEVDGGIDFEPLLNKMKPKEIKMFYTASELLEEFTSMKEPLIDGLLRREEVMNVVAAPKMGKSWLVMQLALGFVCGCPWLGRQCKKSRVLLVDNELHKETLSCRLKRVADSMGIGWNDECMKNLVIYPQRGLEKDMTHLQAHLKSYTGQPFDVVILDALYKALPKDVDENSNGDITGVYNMLDQYAQNMNAAFILVHHTSKGNQGNKNVTDVGSGAGAQSRSPDTHLTLRPHREPGIMVVSCCVRSFPPVEPFCIRRDENNLWILEPNCNPEELDGKDGSLSDRAKKRQMTVEDIAGTIEENMDALVLPKPKTLLVETIRDYTECSKEKAESALELLCEQHLLEIRKGDSAKHQQAMKLFFPGQKSSRYQAPEHPRILSGVKARKN
jgi:hypothetical protein